MNYTDVRNRVGDGLGRVPFVPGVEVSGRILRLGQGSTGWAAGSPWDSRWPRSPAAAAHAEVAVASAALTVPLSEELAARPDSGRLRQERGRRAQIPQRRVGVDVLRIAPDVVELDVRALHAL